MKEKKMTDKTTVRQIDYPQGPITYELTRKKVKRINLRVRPDGSVAVSAAPRVPLAFIDSFVASKASWIAARQQEAAKRFAQPAVPPSKEECLPVFEAAVARFFPAFARWHIAYPQLRVRAMKSRWGSCIPAKNAITLNTWLLTKPAAALEYVVVHELAHLVVPNHSADFYAVVEAVLPDYKARRALLRQ